VLNVSADDSLPYIITNQGKNSISISCNIDNPDLKIDSVELSDGRIFNKISTPDFMTMIGIKEGYPQGPYKLIQVSVPFLSKNYDVSCIGNSIIRSYHTDNPLLPEPGHIGKGWDVEYKYNPSNEPYNTESAKPFAYVHDSYIEDGNNKVVAIAIPLFGYDGNTGTINQYSRYDIELNWADCSADDLNYEMLVQVSNDNGIDTSSVPTKSNASAQLAFSNSSIHYILASECFKEKLSDYITWKQQIGYDVRFQSLEGIKSLTESYSPKPKDDAEGIRMWLKNEFVNNGKFSLLIIGSEDAPAPYRKFATSNTINNSNKNFDTEPFIPSDVYYADINSNYPLFKTLTDKFASPIDSATYSPVISTGRLMLSNQNDLKNYIWKRIVYDINPGFGDMNYLNRLFVFKQNIAYYSKSIADIMDCYSSKVILKDNKSFSFETSRPTGAEAIENMSQSGIMSLQGHGNPATIATSGKDRDSKNWRYIQAINSYSTDTTKLGSKIDPNNGIDLMTNIGKPSVAYSISCTSMPFDKLLYDDTNYRFDMHYNVGSAYTTAGRCGGIAYIGNTRPSYLDTSIPMEISFAELSLNKQSIGKSLNEARKAITKNRRDDQLKLNLLGDPDIKPWLGSPKIISNSVSYGSILNISGNFVAGADIHIWDGVDNTLSLHVPVNLSSLTITREELRNNLSNIISDILVNISKDGYIPDIHLMAPGVSLSHRHKRYILRDLCMSNSPTSMCCYNVQNGGFLELKCYGTFESNGGLVIGNRGLVSINSEINATLENDVIQNGGNIEISAPKVTLNAGFKVEAGGKLTITTN